VTAGQRASRQAGEPASGHAGEPERFTTTGTTIMTCFVEDLFQATGLWSPARWIVVLVVSLW
jgi:hypothetical protein